MKQFTYNVTNLFDNDLTTAWVLGKKQKPLGCSGRAHLAFKLPRAVTHKNCHKKGMAEINLPNTCDWIVIKHPVFNSGGNSLEIAIDSFYPSEKDNDTAISEIMFINL